jgi:glycerophosphoryl diester phosphodiesterase
MSAFRHAYAQGTEMFEIDAHMTMDGHVVVCHDNDLTRLTGQDCRISETIYEGRGVGEENSAVGVGRASSV